MSGLRAGGRAVIIKAYTYRELVGREVELVKIVNDGDIFRSPLTNHLFRNGQGRYGWLCLGEMPNKLSNEDGWGLFGPEQLMPLDGGDFSHERETEYCHTFGV